MSGLPQSHPSRPACPGRPRTGPPASSRRRRPRAAARPGLRRGGATGHQFAVIVVLGGRVVAERYAGALEHFDRAPTPVTAATPLLSWSMAKSMLQAVVGLLVGEGRLDLDEPAAVPEWAAPGDPRHAITLRQLLAMRDGLAWVEDYVDDRVSDVIQMLFGEGQPDMAHFAADRPLAAAPGTRFNYSSGTSNIISGIVARTVGPGRALRPLPARPPLRPARHGQRRPGVRRGGHVGRARPTCGHRPRLRRFGLLYLRDGSWDGVRYSRRAGWTTPARWCRSTTRRTKPPRRPLVGHGRGHARGPRPAGHVPGLGLRGQSITICPAARPRRRAAGQDAARTRARARPLACRHGAGVRIRPLSRAALRPPSGRRRRRGSAGRSSPGIRRTGDRRATARSHHVARSSPSTSAHLHREGRRPVLERDLVGVGHQVVVPHGVLGRPPLEATRAYSPSCSTRISGCLRTLPLLGPPRRHHDDGHPRVEQRVGPLPPEASYSATWSGPIRTGSGSYSPSSVVMDNLGARRLLSDRAPGSDDGLRRPGLTPDLDQLGPLGRRTTSSAR